MNTETISFESGGVPMRGLWRTPTNTRGPFRTILQGPGWLGLMHGANYRAYHEQLCAAGFAVLIIDYRGSGASGGSTQELSMTNQVADLRSALAYLLTRPDVDAGAIGCFGSGGTGAGHPFLLAQAEPSIRACVSVLPVADGTDWLRRMRTEQQWSEFLALLAADRELRSRGEGRLVNPRTEIAIPTAERLTTTIKADVDNLAPSAVSLSAADDLLLYRPIDAARGLRTPSLVVGVQNDDVTPADHAEALYDALAGPKSLLMLEETTHYASYAQYRDRVGRSIVEWFDEHLAPIATPPVFASGTERDNSKAGNDE